MVHRIRYGGVLTVLARYRSHAPAQLIAAGPERREHIRADCRAAPGHGSRLSWNYFLILARLPGVKADRMIRRFVATAIGPAHENAVPPAEAGALVTAAADRLGVEDQILDYVIWRYQSGAPT